MSLWAFRFLLWYICILIVQPQNRFPFLWSLHIADISIIAALVLHGISAMREHRPIIRFGPATVTALFLLLASFVSLYTGVYQTSPAWNPYSDIILKNCIVLILVEASATTADRVWAIQTAMCIASLWWVKAGIRLAQAGATYAGDRIMGPAVGLVENPNNFAYMMCVLIPLYLHFYRQSRQRYVRLAFLILAFAAVYVVFQTGSRTGMMILIVLALFLVPRYAQRHKTTVAISVVAVWFIFSLVGGMNIERFKTIPGQIRSFLAGETKPAIELTQDEQSAQERRLKNKDTWALIKEYPLFGIGVNPNQSFFADKHPMATGQVHCEILMAGRQMGIVGMALYAVLVSMLFFLGRAVQKKTDSWWPSVAELGWTYKLQMLVFAVGGFFSPLPWNAIHLVLAGSVSALWLNLGRTSAAGAPADEALMAAAVPG